MKMDEIKKLIAELEDSKLHKLVYKKGDFEIHLEKENISYPVSPQPMPVNGASPAVQQVAETPKEKEAEGTFITSPMVGTFYAGSSPDQPPLVKVGDKVNKGTVVCIIEAMKVMNEVKAECSGTVEEVAIHNGQAVEFGTRLFRIVP